MNGSADSGHAAEFGRKCSGTVWMTACILSLFSFWNGGGSSRSVSCRGGSISNYSGSIGDAVVASAAATSASSFGSGVCSGIRGSSGSGSDDGSVLMVEATHKGPPPGVCLRFCYYFSDSFRRIRLEQSTVQNHSSGHLRGATSLPEFTQGGEQWASSGLFLH